MPEKPLYILSLMTGQNLYQREQQRVAEGAAQELGVELRVLDADNDAVTQTQQLLSVIQDKRRRPAGVIVSAVGSAMPQVMQAASIAGIGWAMMNREVEGMNALRQRSGAPVFMVLPDHVEIGRVMARQAAALLPQGGRALLLTGPSSGFSTIQRAEGFRGALPGNIEIRTIHGMWTRDSGRRAISSLLALSMKQDQELSLVAAQNDDMAMGAREAFQGAGLQWSRLQYIGVDGMAQNGQAWVRQGVMAATQIIPPTADIALHAMVEARDKGKQPPEKIRISPVSYPAIESLHPLADARA